MKINPYLNFNGQCKAAFEFYEKCLGGKIVMMQTFGESPMGEQSPPDFRDKIIHARLAGDGFVLMGSDAPPERFKQPQGFSVTLQFENPADAERVFNALAEKGQVQMPLTETFWAARFGMLVDRFGTPWMINCEAAA